jgi:hypothetical protein
MPQCQFLFFAIFVFQKNYTGNIIGIGRDKSQTSYFSRHEDGVQSRDRGGHRGRHTIGWRAPLLAVLLCGVGPLGALWHRPSAYKMPPMWKPKIDRHPSTKSSTAPSPLKTNFGGQKSLFRRPARMSNCPGAISIDSTAIFMAVANSHDKDGVVLPRGWGLYR